MSEFADDHELHHKDLKFSEIDSKKWIKKRQSNKSLRKRGIKSHRSDYNQMTPKGRESSKNSDKDDAISFDHYHQDENR